MSEYDHEHFLATWDVEAEQTVRVLRSLPREQYDFRPDPGMRTLGELAWHIAEIEGRMSFGIEQGEFDVKAVVPNLERPRTVAALAPGYERVHREAMARLRGLDPEDYDAVVTFFDGRPISIRNVLWDGIIHHQIHHRGQLVLLCRLAGGQPPGIYGPSREEMAALAAARNRG
jgi:uncharacterized damage-inducible protein DinB